MHKNQINKLKTKLYIFHPYSGQGGADLSISRLINGLDEDKYEIDFLSLNLPLIRKKIFKKIKYYQIKSTRTIFSFSQIKKYIHNDNKKYKKKIFISNQYFANVLSSFFLGGVKKLKLVFLERNHLDEFKFFKGFLDYLKKKLIKILIKFSYYRADLIIGNSNSLSNNLKNFIGTKVHTIYNPCFFPKKKKRKKILKKNYSTILNVARLESQKDQLTLIKAIHNLKEKEKSKIKVIIVGYGSLLKSLNNYIKLNNLQKIIKIYPNVSDVTKFYSQADLFILSSLYEGFPNVLVEAAEYDIPIISTNCNSGPNEILSNGKGGYLVNKKDYLLMSKRIEFFLDSKKEFIKKAKFCKKKLNRFDNKKNIKKFDNLFESL
jgi:glycosyltransferase involved in cell wall biosynthesis